ncbi:unnamed protein product [Protopolystoma xenopodis]|uniref:Uncharacterized protein n=1 Tax=Protopolystoma xenopodis TaxID=117903 RepID=A0A448XLK3_9PLAT|nr:unnamed protein product [Protopolystoma xenopodis]
MVWRTFKMLICLHHEFGKGGPQRSVKEAAVPAREWRLLVDREDILDAPHTTLLSTMDQADDQNCLV